jgi:hypothetical protein
LSSNPELGGFALLNKMTKKYLDEFISKAYSNLNDFDQAEEYAYKLIITIYSIEYLDGLADDRKKRLSEYYLRTAILSQKFKRMKGVYQMLLKNENFQWDENILYYINLYCK